MKLYLDDIRPTPEGWTRAYTDMEARFYLTEYVVEEASLDHDLGCCDECSEGLSAWEWIEKYGGKSMPNCEHFGTGTTLCNWMAETGNWPLRKPTVHSANPVGRARMEGIIDRYWKPRE